MEEQFGFPKEPFSEQFLKEPFVFFLNVNTFFHYLETFVESHSYKERFFIGIFGSMKNQSNLRTGINCI